MVRLLVAESRLSIKLGGVLVEIGAYSSTMNRGTECSLISSVGSTLHLPRPTGGGCLPVCARVARCETSSGLL